MIQTVAQPDRSPLPNAVGDRSRPTVCHVVHSLGVGGAELLINVMARQLQDEFRPVIACLDEIGEIGEALREDGFTVQMLHRKPGIDVGCASRLRRFAEQENAGLFHSHQYTPFFQAMLSRGIRRSIPILFTEHGRHVPDQPGRKRLLANRMLLRRGDRVVGVGESVRQALIQNEGLPEDRVDVVYNGVDLDAFASPRSDARLRIRGEFGIGESDPVMILVARLDVLKDHLTAVRTVAAVRESITNTRLLLVGDGDQRATIEEEVIRLGLCENVILAGIRSDIPDLLAASDLFLMTSISEGIPLTIIEAMAAGLPVIATAVGGIPEMIEDGVSGRLCQAGDFQALANAALWMLKSRQLRREIVRAGKAAMEQRFSQEAMLQRYREIYRGMICRPATKQSLLSVVKP